MLVYETMNNFVEGQEETWDVLEQVDSVVVVSLTSRSFFNREE